MEPNCYQIAVGKGATADNSVMVARSCDAMGDYAQQILAIPKRQNDPKEVLKFKKLIMKESVEVPQVKETYGYIAIVSPHEEETLTTNEGKKPLLWLEGGINEFQVSAGSSSGGRLNAKAAKIIPVMKSSLGKFRTTLVLERCKTAREGIQLLGKLTEKYGAREDYYIIADKEEAWYYEEYRDHLWAAVRVPDDSFIVVANHSRIREVNLNDSKNYMGARNLISFAIENDLYNPDNGEPFNTMKVYGNHQPAVRRGISTSYNQLREWRGISLLAPSTSLDPEGSVFDYPLFAKPDVKPNPKMLLSILADHYQGTKYDFYKKKSGKYSEGKAKKTNPVYYPKGVIQNPLRLDDKFEYQLSPVWNPVRVIGTPRSVTNWCAQLRNWMPNPIGGLLWAGLSETATTAHIPFYSGITRTPEAFRLGSQKAFSLKPFTTGSICDDSSAYWTFRRVANLVNLFYDLGKNEVIPVWRAWEEKLYKIQSVIEESALKLYKKDQKLAAEFLTSYSNSKAIESLKMAKEMLLRLHTVIAHYNSPFSLS